jgi:hypothetical protein
VGGGGGGGGGGAAASAGGGQHGGAGVERAVKETERKNKGHGGGYFE